MQPILTVEFTAKSGEYGFKEESVPMHTPEEFFEFVSPGGACENIPDEVEEIRIIFLPPEHRNTRNPIADSPSMLQLHSVIFTGSLSEIAQTAEQIIDKAGRGELSESFLRVVGAKTSS